MLELEEDHPDIFEFHEGMNGGTNDRGEANLNRHLRRLVLWTRLALDENNRRC